MCSWLVEPTRLKHHISYSEWRSSQEEWKICETTMFYLSILCQGSSNPLNILNFNLTNLQEIAIATGYTVVIPWLSHGYSHWPRQRMLRTASCWTNAICLCSTRVKGRVHESWSWGPGPRRLCGTRPWKNGKTHHVFMEKPPWADKWPHIHHEFQDGTRMNMVICWSMDINGQIFTMKLNGTW